MVITATAFVFGLVLGLICGGYKSHKCNEDRGDS